MYELRRCPFEVQALPEEDGGIFWFPSPIFQTAFLMAKLSKKYFVLKDSPFTMPYNARAANSCGRRLA